MTSNKISLTFLLACGLAFAGCTDDTPAETESATDTETGDGDPGDGDGDPGDGDGDPDPCATDPGAEGCACDDSSTCNDGLLCLDASVCEPDPFDKTGTWDRVDRAGMPAVNSAVITSKDAYNQATPVDDDNGDFQQEIFDNIQALHMALDDDLTGLNLVPCTPFDCVDQAGPLVIPDTLKIDYAVDAGFPNGRALADPVIDVTLAVILLDLMDQNQDVTTLVGVLNPDANDVAFDENFPYLAAPN